MIEHASLKALVDISQHPTLADRLVEVLISTDMFGYPWISDAQYAADDTSREWLLRTGQARDMLSKAFAKLKNLRIVGLRDFNSKGRLREGSEEALWRSYGKLCYVLCYDSYLNLIFWASHRSHAQTHR